MRRKPNRPGKTEKREKLKKNLLRWGSVALLLGGLCLLASPSAFKAYQNYRQEKMMEEWRAGLSALNAAPSLPDLPPAESAITPAESVSSEPEETAGEKYVRENMLGIMKIDKIGLQEPVLKGTTDMHLALALSTIEPCAQPGDLGNFSVAGHRARGYGLDFNRLDELETGDWIVMETSTGTYTYAVTEKLFVQPDEVWVLNNQPGVRTVTLVTCHPVVNATQRLIIKGVLVG